MRFAGVADENGAQFAALAPNRQRNSGCRSALGFYGADRSRGANGFGGAATRGGADAIVGDSRLSTRLANDERRPITESNRTAGYGIRRESEREARGNRSRTADYRD